MNKPIVSVIIPTYNNSAYLANAIESAIAQTFRDIEIIVIDDGSTDDTQKVLTCFGDKIQVIHQCNQGPSAARNAGLRKSQGNYIAFLDSDDQWLPDKLTRQMPLFEMDPQVGVVFSDTFYVYKGKIQPKTSFQLRPPSSGFIFNSLFGKNFIPMLTAIVRRECFNQVGFFDENLKACEDYDMWLRISKSWKFAYVAEPLALYSVIEGQLSGQVERNWGNFLVIQKRTYEENHDLLLSISQLELDHYFYNFYLTKLAKEMLKTRQKRKAEFWIEQYRLLRGITPLYLCFLLASKGPSGLVSKLVSRVDQKRQHPELGR
jgi:glycosyltransferase involved in cell wall biosynthesis